MTFAEQVTDPSCYHAEGPVWWDAWGGLRWVDMLAGDVVRPRADGAVIRHHVGDHAAVIRPRIDGGLVVAHRSHIGVVTASQLAAGAGRSVPLTPALWADEDLAFNEGATDPQGRLWCGSMSLTEGGTHGALHRIDPTGSSTVAIGGIGISNGLAWAPDGSRAYYVDSLTQGVDVLHLAEDGAIDGRERWVEVSEELGCPDGLCVDAEGYVWVALWDGYAVRRYRPDGTLDGQVRVPVPRVTACTFGGPHLDELFITTSQEDLDMQAFPASGAVFSIRLDVIGTPTVPFGG